MTHVEFHPIVCEHVGGTVCAHVSPSEREAAVSLANATAEVPSALDLTENANAKQIDNTITATKPAPPVAVGLEPVAFSHASRVTPEEVHALLRDAQFSDELREEAIPVETPEPEAEPVSELPDEATLAEAATLPEEPEPEPAHQAPHHKTKTTTAAKRSKKK